MDNKFPLTVEAALVFFVIFFVAFCCGFFRSLKKYFAQHEEPPQALPTPPSVLVTHLRIGGTRDVSVAIPPEEPPPYSAVYGILPPSYDEATKQDTNQNNQTIQTNETNQSNQTNETNQNNQTNETNQSNQTNRTAERF